MPDTLSKIKSRHYTRSSSFKMALLFTVLCGLSVLILSYFTHYFTRGHFILGTEALIDTEIDNFRLWQDNANTQKMLMQKAEQAGRIFLYLSPEGKKIAGNLNAMPIEAQSLSEGIIILDKNNDTLRQYAAKIHTFPDQSRVLFGVDITDVAADYRLMQNLSLLTIALMLLVIATSYAISSFVVSRTNRIAQTARTIMTTGDLSRRIKIDSRWDDLSYVGVVLNDFLERTQDLMQGIRVVSDSIAHDLRTPLTRLLAHLEQAKDNPKNAQAVEDFQRLHDEAQRLLTTFNAILRISRIETGRQSGEFKTIALDALLRDVLDFYDPLAEEKHITLSANLAPTTFTGDRDLIFQTISNILDNALKFSPANSTIAITLETSQNIVNLSISDQGPGIAPQDKDKVFRRFYRAESSRAAPGNGLGLALVQAVIALHHGQITLRDNSPSGLCIDITLPRFNFSAIDE